MRCWEPRAGPPRPRRRSRTRILARHVVACVTNLGPPHIITLCSNSFAAQPAAAELRQGNDVWWPYLSWAASRAAGPGRVSPPREECPRRGLTFFLFKIILMKQNYKRLARSEARVWMPGTGSMRPLGGRPPRRPPRREIPQCAQGGAGKRCFSSLPLPRATHLRGTRTARAPGRSTRWPGRSIVRSYRVRDASNASASRRASRSLGSRPSITRVSSVRSSWPTSGPRGMPAAITSAPPMARSRTR